MRIFEPISFETRPARGGFQFHPFSTNFINSSNGYRRLWDQPDHVYGQQLQRPPIHTHRLSQQQQEPNTLERIIPIIVESRNSSDRKTQVGHYERLTSHSYQPEHRTPGFVKDRERDIPSGQSYQYEILLESSDESDMDTDVILYSDKNNSGFKNGKRQRPRTRRASPLQSGTEERSHEIESSYDQRESAPVSRRSTPAPSSSSNHGDLPSCKRLEDYSGSRSESCFGRETSEHSPRSGKLFELVAQRNVTNEITVDHTPSKQRAIGKERPCCSFPDDDPSIKEHRSYFDLLKQRREKDSELNFKELKQSEKENQAKLIVPTPSYPAYAYLKPVLKKSGRQVDYVKGDGNCFFRALSKVIFETEHCHEEVRQAVVDLLEKYPREFEQYLDNISLHDHIIEMRKGGTWGTQTEIYAAATLLQRPIYVLSPDHMDDTYRWLLFSPRFQYSNSIVYHPCYITLCHTNGNHYDRIAPIEGDCNCLLPPPTLSGITCEVDLTDAVV